MLKIQQLKLPVVHTKQELEEKIQKIIKIPKKELLCYKIIKRSLDARGGKLQYVYTIEIKVKKETEILKRCSAYVTKSDRVIYQFPALGEKKMQHRPVIVGTGPAGLFCGLMLARAGYRPILIERGQRAKERAKSVKRFWKDGILDIHSNVQFGEGGAGTFSDGKLNTLVKDPMGRNRKVLELFVEAGAPEEILYEHKPHLGTDVLIQIVEHIRKEIVRLGGEVRFDTLLKDIQIEENCVKGAVLEDIKGETEVLSTELLVLAVGHSARDTFSMLKKHKVPMQAKAFAVGVRVEHPQEMINLLQYGKEYPPVLPAASYKVTRKTKSGRGVYSFCMCPGGYVVNASSEAEALAVNGMSYQARDSRNANSAMIVTVTPEDFGGTDVLSGVEFQRKLERAAYQAGEGRIPVQTFQDFCQNTRSTVLGEIAPCIKGAYQLSNVREIFPEELSKALEEGILGCEQILPGFARKDMVLSGVESRTSSPVRIVRDERLESEVCGLYPCGEGAGYAGGITSAAMDGLKIAEAIAKTYAPCYDYR